MILTDLELQTPEEFRILMDDLRPRLMPHFDPVSLCMVDLAVTECLVNAWEHGNQRDPAKSVTVRISLTNRRLLIRIADEGPGFSPSCHGITCPDTHREDGRGLFLIREIMDDVRWNKQGNDFLLIRHMPCKNASVQQARGTPQEAGRH